MVDGELTVVVLSLVKISPRLTDLLPMPLDGLPSHWLTPNWQEELWFNFHMQLVLLNHCPSTLTLTELPSTVRRIGPNHQENFDLRPGVIVKELDLARPIYFKTASYGHFTNQENPWEQPKN